jgi:hypothetical protein
MCMYTCMDMSASECWQKACMTLWIGVSDLNYIYIYVCIYIYIYIHTWIGVSDVNICVHVYAYM